MSPGTQYVYKVASATSATGTEQISNEHTFTTATTAPGPPASGDSKCTNDGGTCTTIVSGSNTGGYFERGKCSGANERQCKSSNSEIKGCQSCLGGTFWCYSSTTGYCAIDSCLPGYNSVPSDQPEKCNGIIGDETITPPAIPTGQCTAADTPNSLILSINGFPANPSPVTVTSSNPTQLFVIIRDGNANGVSLCELQKVKFYLSGGGTNPYASYDNVQRCNSGENGAGTYTCHFDNIAPPNAPYAQPGSYVFTAQVDGTSVRSSWTINIASSPTQPTGTATVSFNGFSPGTTINFNTNEANRILSVNGRGFTDAEFASVRFEFIGGLSSNPFSSYFTAANPIPDECTGNKDDWICNLDLTGFITPSRNNYIFNVNVNNRRLATANIMISSGPNTGTYNGQNSQNVPCNQACLTPTYFSGAYTSYYSQQRAVIPTGDCTSNPQAFIQNYILSTQIASQSGVSANTYVQQPVALQPPGAYGCKPGETCVCTVININGFTSAFTSPSPTLPGTQTTHNWQAPDAITNPPKAAPNEHDCTQAASASITATLAGEAGKLILAGDTVTINGHVDKLSNTCKGYEYTCRYQIDAGCDIKHDWYYLGANNHLEYNDCPSGTTVVHEEGEGRSPNWQVIGGAALVAAGAFGCGGPCFQGGISAIAAGYGNQARCGSGGLQISATQIYAMFQAANSLRQGNNNNNAASSSSGTTSGSTDLQVTVTFSPSNPVVGTATNNVVLITVTTNPLTDFDNVYLRVPGTPATLLTKLSTGVYVFNTYFEEPGVKTMVFDLVRNGQPTISKEVTINVQASPTLQSCSQCVGAGTGYCRETGQCADSTDDCPLEPVFDCSGITGAATAKPTIDITGKAGEWQGPLQPGQSPPNTGSSFNYGPYVYAATQGISQLPACPSQEDYDKCFRICGKTYQSAVAAAPICDKGGPVIAAKQANYPCTLASCGSFGGREVKIEIKGPDGSTVIDDRTTTDSAGDFSYTFAAPAADGQFTAIVSVPGFTRNATASP